MTTHSSNNKTENIDYESIFSKENADKLISAINDCRRIERNKMMYYVFTPIYIKIWHRMRNKKPYINLSYEPKF